jgi:hypothetical protein
MAKILAGHGVDLSLMRPTNLKYKDYKIQLSKKDGRWYSVSTKGADSHEAGPAKDYKAIIELTKAEIDKLGAVTSATTPLNKCVSEGDKVIEISTGKTVEVGPMTSKHVYVVYEKTPKMVRGVSMSVKDFNKQFKAIN